MKSLRKFTIEKNVRFEQILKIIKIECVIDTIDTVSNLVLIIDNELVYSELSLIGEIEDVIGKFLYNEIYY